MTKMIIEKNSERKSPIVIFTNDKIKPNDGAIEKLEEIAKIDGIYKNVIALPDLHYKIGRIVPTGIAVATKDKIIPKLLNANCGMSFITTNLTTKDLDEEKTDKIFSILKKNITPTTRTKPIITKNDLNEIMLTGVNWAYKKYNLDKEDIKNIEYEGNMFKNKDVNLDYLHNIIPRDSLKLGLLSLGVLGLGNHFLELQRVDKVLSKDLANKFGLKNDQIIILIHSDSGAFGLSIHDYYSDKTKQLLGLHQIYKKLYYRIYLSSKEGSLTRDLLKKIHNNINKLTHNIYWKGRKTGIKKKETFPEIKLDSKQGKAYLYASYAAMNYGFVNRSILLANVKNALEEVFNKKLKFSLLYNGNHDALQEEDIDGEKLIVHRNGASRAYPSKFFKNHPIFKKTGQPVVLPGSIGTFNYICAAVNGNKDSLYNSSHGVGRRIDRPEARKKFNEKNFYDEIGKVRLYRYNVGNIVEEIPSSFKNVEEVIKVLSDNKISKPVARLKTIASLKGN